MTLKQVFLERKNMTVDELIETFSLCDDWEARYEVLLDMGQTLPPMDESLKTDENLVPGCTSRVWMTSTPHDTGNFDFTADSDAHIVKGLIAILRVVYAGKAQDELTRIDVAAIFHKLGLEDHLTPNRRNGFYAMVERIQQFGK